MMARGGKRPNSGRKPITQNQTFEHGGKRTNSGRKTRMEINNFDGFEQELLIAYLNHRFNEPYVEVPGLFIITYDDKLWMSLTRLREIFGSNASERLRHWFDVEEGSNKTEVLSRLTLKTGTVNQVALYNWLKKKGLIKQLRRDSDGIIDSWVDTVEWKIKMLNK